jgi:hypothetical protein
MESARAALEVAEVAYVRVLGVVRRPPPSPLPWAGGDPNAPTAPWGWDDTLAEDPLARATSPRWSIAALTRIAMGWARYLEQFRAIPVPPWPRGPLPGLGGLTYEELRMYGGGGDEPAGAYKDRAKRACARVLQLGLAHHVADENTRTCETWFARHYGAEIHVLDELRPRIATPWAAGPFAPVR